MSKFRVTVKSNSVHYDCCRPYDIYEVIDKITNDPMAAIEASSWCELACIGEVYEEYNDRFSIEVIER